MGVKLDGPNDWNWTVQKTESGRTAKVDGPEIGPESFSLAQDRPLLDGLPLSRDRPF